MAIKNSSDYIDVRALLRTYILKWYYFVISVVVCCLLGIVYCRINPDELAVRANVLIQQENTNPMASFGGLDRLFGSNGYVDDEIFVISSHSLYRDVAEELQTNKTHYVRDGFLKSHLAYPEFPIDVTAPAVADTLRTVVVFKVKVKKNGMADITAKAKRHTVAKLKNVTLPAVVKTIYGDFTVETTLSFPKGEEVSSKILFAGYDRAAEDLSRDIEVDIPSRKSNVISLAFDVPNSDYGRAILNAVMSKYNDRGIVEKNQQAEKTAIFLKDRIELLAHDLNIAESDIQKYKENNKIIDVVAEATYQTEKKGRLEAELLEAETDMEILKMTRDFLENSANAYDMIPLTINNQEMQEGIKEYNELVLRRENLKRNAKEHNYALKQLNKQIDLMRTNILSSVSKAYDGARIQLAELRKEKSGADSKLSNIPTQEREFLNMKRQQEVKQQLYLFLLQRQEENAMLFANPVPKGVIIDEAFTLTEPLGLSAKWILVICFFIGLCIPPVGIYLYRLLRDKIDSRDDVEKNLSVPILGEMCQDGSGRSLVVADKDSSSSNELFRLLRSNLQFMLNHKEDKVVLLTSTQSGEGKTFIAINLAASLSLLQGKRVLLVGMDIRKPQVANYLEIPDSVGLTSYLAESDMNLDSIIRPVPGFNNLDVIVAGPIPPNPAELLTSTKVEELFAVLRNRYDYIIVDSAPVGMVSDTFTLNRIADAVIYVTRINHSSLSDLKFIESIYEDKRLKNMSVVVNGTKVKRGYGYGYGNAVSSHK